MPEVMSTDDMYKLAESVAAEIGVREFYAGPGTEEADRMAIANDVRQDFHDLLAAGDAYAMTGESMSYGGRKPPKANLPRFRRVLEHYGIRTEGTEVRNSAAYGRTEE